MISFNGNDDSDGCFSRVNNIISLVNKEKIIVTMSYDEVELSTVGSGGKKLLRVKHMLNKCNMGKYVMTFVSNIFKSLDAVNFEKGVFICEIQ